MTTTLKILLAAVLHRVLEREQFIEKHVTPFWSDRSLKIQCLKLADELETYAASLKE